VAVAVRLELHWVTVAWAVEALMLTWAGLRAGEDAVRRAGLAVFAVAVAHWLQWDMLEFGYHGGDGFAPLLNRRALSCAVLVAALAAAAWLYRRGASAGVDDDERDLARNLFLLAGNALALVLLTLDVNDYFRARLALEEGAAAGASARRVEIARQFSLTVLWSFYGATLVVFGLLRRLAARRYVALLVLAAAAAKVLAVDSAFYAEETRVPLINQTFMAYALLVLALGACLHFYRRASGVGEGERRVMLPALVVASNILAVVALSIEASGYFAARIRAGAHTEEALRDLRLARQLSLSVVWAVYGGALFAAGRLRGARLLRVMALALLGLTTLKVFFWDLSSLDRAYRIVSFVVLGLILLAVSYLYQKSQQRAPGAEEEAADAT
jgi:uncharacterized membrane protein